MLRPPSTDKGHSAGFHMLAIQRRFGTDLGMKQRSMLRLGLIVIALAAITLGLNLMNVRNDFALLAGAIASLGGMALGGVQLWSIYKDIEK